MCVLSMYVSIYICLYLPLSQMLSHVELLPFLLRVYVNKFPEYTLSTQLVTASNNKISLRIKYRVERKNDLS